MGSPRRAASALRLCAEQPNAAQQRQPPPQVARRAPSLSTCSARPRRQRRSARDRSLRKGVVGAARHAGDFRAVIKATAGAIAHERGFRVRVVAELVASPREEHGWFPLLGRPGTFALEPRALQRAAEQPSRDLRLAEPSSRRNSPGEAQPPPFSKLEEESLLWFFGSASLCLCWFVQKPSHRQSVSTDLCT